MKKLNFKEKTNEELAAEYARLKTELFNLRFSHASGQLTNPKMLNLIKKDIARVLTEMESRGLKRNNNMPKKAVKKAKKTKKIKEEKPVKKAEAKTVKKEVPAKAASAKAPVAAKTAAAPAKTAEKKPTEKKTAQAPAKAKKGE